MNANRAPLCLQRLKKDRGLIMLSMYILYLNEYCLCIKTVSNETLLNEFPIFAHRDSRLLGDNHHYVFSFYKKSISQSTSFRKKVYIHLLDWRDGLKVLTLFV